MSLQVEALSSRFRRQWWNQREVQFYFGWTWKWMEAKNFSADTPLVPLFSEKKWVLYFFVNNQIFKRVEDWLTLFSACTQWFRIKGQDRWIAEPEDDTESVPFVNPNNMCKIRTKFETSNPVTWVHSYPSSYAPEVNSQSEEFRGIIGAWTVQRELITNVPTYWRVPQMVFVLEPLDNHFDKPKSVK